MAQCPTVVESREGSRRFGKGVYLLIVQGTYGLSGLSTIEREFPHFTEQNLCGEFRHMKTPQRTPHVVVIQDVVKMT